MKTRNSFLLTAFALAMLSLRGYAALTTIDQQNTGGTGDFGSSVTQGESFTPSQTTINAATFSLALGGGVSNTLQLDLRSGDGVNGNVLATSFPVTITNTSFQTVEFNFPSAITLLPGNVYTLLVGSTIRLQFIMSLTGNNYAGGVNYGGGFPMPNFDARFAEGTDAAVLPEPSTWAVFAVGAGLSGLTLCRRGRKV